MNLPICPAKPSRSQPKPHSPFPHEKSTRNPLNMISERFSFRLFLLISGKFFGCGHSRSVGADAHWSPPFLSLFCSSLVKWIKDSPPTCGPVWARKRKENFDNGLPIFSKPPEICQSRCTVVSWSLSGPCLCSSRVLKNGSWRWSGVMHIAVSPLSLLCSASKMDREDGQRVAGRNASRGG